MRKNRLGGPVDRADIQIERGLEPLFAQLDGATHVGDPDIVVQNIDPAELGERLYDGCLNRLALSDIGGHGDGGPSLSLDDVGGFGGGLLNNVDAHDLRPLTCERG